MGGIGPYLAGAVLAYLAGSVPFGLLLTRIAGYGDIRRIGSGNIGATNVLRTGNKGLAALTLLLDGGKGAVAALVAHRWGLDMACVAAVSVVLGHLHPVWLRFKGGKGVATTLGALLGLAWPVGLAACAAWLLAAAVTRISSAGAIVAMAAAPVAGFLLADARVGGVALALGAVVIAKHHANIRRLLAGTEPRIGKT